MDKTLHLLILMFNCQDLVHDERRSRDCLTTSEILTIRKDTILHGSDVVSTIEDLRA